MAPNEQRPKAFDINPPQRKRPQPSFPDVGMTLGSYQSSFGPPAPARSISPNKNNQTTKAGWRAKITKKRLIITILIVLLLIGGYVGIKFLINAQKLFGGNIFSALTSEKLDGEDEGRVNILLAGNSADDVGHQGAELTDSIMILSIDTKNKTGFLMSVPRDLYVKVNDAHAKINTVYPTGKQSGFSEGGYATGGMGLLQKTIDEDLGIKTHYYALVNYNALRDAVNSVGGVTVNIASSDRRGLYDPSKDYSTGGVLVRLANGQQKLNGQQALNLARARGDARGSYGFPASDFDRTKNQQMIILALRQKATSAGVLTNPVRLGSLFDSVGNNVDTDLELGNVRRLYEITKDISSTNIKSISLNDANGKNLLQNYRTYRGESALVPAEGLDDYSAIKSYVQRLMSNNLIVRENARVVALNGTSTVGLASKQAKRIEAKNITVSQLADADTEDYTTTQIINISGGSKPATLKSLQATFPGSTVTTTNPYGTKYDAEFIVVLGTDRLSTQSSN